VHVQSRTQRIRTDQMLENVYHHWLCQEHALNWIRQWKKGLILVSF
jgi:hypothetical protein